MNKRLVLFISLVALLTVGALPWLWRWSPAVAALCALGISVWCIWLIVVYLKWASTLGHTSSDQSSSPSDRGETPSAPR